jgi:hypothetical protein
MPLCSKLSRLLGWMNPPADPNRRAVVRGQPCGVGEGASIAGSASPLGPRNSRLRQHPEERHAAHGI